MAGHAYRYRAAIVLVIDDRVRLGPEILTDLLRGVLRAVPGLRGRVHVELDELERLDD